MKNNCSRLIDSLKLDVPITLENKFKKVRKEVLQPKVPERFPKALIKPVKVGSKGGKGPTTSHLLQPLCSQVPQRPSLKPPARNQAYYEYNGAERDLDLIRRRVENNEREIRQELDRLFHQGGQVDDSFEMPEGEGDRGKEGKEGDKERNRQFHHRDRKEHGQHTGDMEFYT